MTNKSRWVPEIMYEEVEDGLTSSIPFIQVPEGEKMPNVLFFFESRETGETEPGPEGEDLPVTEMDLHQYCDMATLKEKLSWIEYDNVRYVLGLEPLEEATLKGQEISGRIRERLGVTTSEEDST
jgi:hypothetical protein